MRISSDVKNAIFKELTPKNKNQVLPTYAELAQKYGVSKNTIGRIKNRCIQPDKPVSNKAEKSISVDESKDNMSITTKSLDIRTVEQALAESNVDMNVWEIDRTKINSWEVTMKMKGKDGTSDRAETFTNYQVGVWLKRKSPEKKAIESLLDEIKSNKLTYPEIERVQYLDDWVANKDKQSRELEVNIMDPHMGLHCFKPQSDHTWSMDECEEMVLEMLERIILDAQLYGPFEQVIFPFGNDFLHAEGTHCTTKGTPQAEMDNWSEVFLRGQKLAIAMVERLKHVAPVKVISIPGNHDQRSGFTMGQLLAAYYHNDENVTVDASPNPYKFHHFGVNLIGYEHGHNVKPQLRLASLMANECRDIWAETVYREWHLGDQHRKGSSKTSAMEEQGVSVEFLPGLCPPNEWHRMKGFNWQKRAAMAFIWDKTAGPVARLQVNIDSYSGRIMG